MVMHVRTEGDKSLRQNLRLLLNLFESKPHIIIIFHLKTNGQNLEKISRKWVSNPYSTRLQHESKRHQDVPIQGVSSVFRTSGRRKVHVLDVSDF